MVEKLGPLEEGAGLDGGIEAGPVDEDVGIVGFAGPLGPGGPGTAQIQAGVDFDVCFQPVSGVNSKLPVVSGTEKLPPRPPTISILPL